MARRDRPLEYSSVTAPVVEYLCSLPNAKAINIHGSVYMERGTPDVMGTVGGRTVVFECKNDPSEKLEDIQYWRLAQWLEAGAVVGGVSSVKDVEMILCLMGVI